MGPNYKPLTPEVAESSGGVSLIPTFGAAACSFFSNIGFFRFCRNLLLPVTAELPFHCQLSDIVTESVAYWA